MELASGFGIKQIEKISKMDVKIDFNQGLDARLIDQQIANLLAKCKWTRFIRLSCDFNGMLPVVIKAVEMLRIAGYRGEISCYVLVTEIETALYRVTELSKIKVDPFAQAFIGRSGVVENKMLKHFARWVNHKAIFKTVEWENYKKNLKKR